MEKLNVHDIKLELKTPFLARCHLPREVRRQVAMQSGRVRHEDLDAHGAWSHGGVGVSILASMDFATAKIDSVMLAHDGKYHDDHQLAYMGAMYHAIFYAEDGGTVASGWWPATWFTFERLL